MKPGWQGLRGHQRVAAECKQLGRDIAAGKLPQLWDLEPHNDAASLEGQAQGAQLPRLCPARSRFDEDLPGGAQINRDLQQLAHQYGRQYGHIQLEVSFPHIYPTKPLFLRVVRPRMVMYTGHVTAGGSICIEALSLTGSPSGWQPSYCLESILQLAMANMVDTPVMRVHTTTGPGGMSGPLRVDFNYPPWQEYSYHEARDAFQRTEEHHRRTGWGGCGGAPRPPGFAGRAHGWGGSGGSGGSSSRGRSFGGDGGLVGLMAAFGSSHHTSGTGGGGSSAPSQRPPPAAPKQPPTRPAVPPATTPPPSAGPKPPLKRPAAPPAPTAPPSAAPKQPPKQPPKRPAVPRAPTQAPPAAPKQPPRRAPALPASSQPATSRSPTRTSADRQMPANPSKASGSKPPAKPQPSPREMAAAATAARAAAAAKDASRSAQAEVSTGGKQRRREEPTREQPPGGTKRPRLEGSGGAGPRTAAAQKRAGSLGQARAGARQPPARSPAPAATGSGDVIDLTDDAPTSRPGTRPAQRSTHQWAAAAGDAPVIDLTGVGTAPTGSGGSRHKAQAQAQAEVVDLTLEVLAGHSSRHALVKVVLDSPACSLHSASGGEE